MALSWPRALGLCGFRQALHEHLGVRRDSRASAGERESQPDHSRRVREHLTLGTLGTLGSKLHARKRLVDAKRVLRVLRESITTK